MSWNLNCKPKPNETGLGLVCIVYIDINMASREAELLNQMNFACFAAKTQQACCTKSVICNLVDLQ